MPGFVWREAFPGDRVCVDPGIRNLVAEENRLGPSRLASAVAPPLPEPPPPPIPAPGPGPGGGGASPMPDLPLPPLSAPLAISPYFNDGVRPGLYMVRAVHSNLCIGTFVRDNGTMHFAAAACREAAPNRPLVAVVQQDGRMSSIDPFSYSLRPGAANRNNGGLCGGIAEGVVLGPPAIDITSCRNVGGAVTGDACQNGNLERQKFALRRLTGTERPNWYRIHTSDRNPGLLALPHSSSLPHCVSVRDSSRDFDAEHINWGCKTDRSDPNFFDQVFEFTLVAPLPPELAACRNTRR